MERVGIDLEAQSILKEINDPADESCNSQTCPQFVEGDFSSTNETTNSVKDAHMNSGISADQMKKMISIKFSANAFGPNGLRTRQYSTNRSDRNVSQNSPYLLRVKERKSIKLGLEGEIEDIALSLISQKFK